MSFWDQLFGNRPGGYASPGAYKRGYWLVVNKNGAAAIFAKNNLPPTAPGRQFYWLGATQRQADNRLPGAIGTLNLGVSTIPTSVAGAGTKPIGISGDWGTPGGGRPRVFTVPTTAAPATVPGASYASGGGGGPFGFLSGLSGAITSVTDFLALAAWLVHPLNWLRAAEFVGGLFLTGFGFYLLTHRYGATSRSVTSNARRFISITPAGRTIRVAQGRHMGRHEGQREAARMEARQAETRSQRESSALEREQINRRARQSARQA